MEDRKRKTRGIKERMNESKLSCHCAMELKQGRLLGFLKMLTCQRHKIFASRYTVCRGVIRYNLNFSEGNVAVFVF